MANAVRLAKRNERLEREMNDMDKMACAINSEKSALSKKLTKTEVIVFYFWLHVHVQHL
jgi:hypothetical protein